MSTEVDVARAIAAMLVSDAAHAQAISSLTAIGEITLRDASVVAVAAVGAKLRRAWIVDREIVPEGWSDAAVDVLVKVEGNNDSEHLEGGIELKWWRRSDAANSSNRRRDLFRDLVRAAALYSTAREFALVGLLSTPESWDRTLATKGADSPIGDRLKATGDQSWSLRLLRACPTVQAAAIGLSGKVPVTSSFRTNLIAHARLTVDGASIADARVWSVRKTRKSKWLTPNEISLLFA